MKPSIEPSWRTNALLSLEDARAEIANATEPMICVVLTIAEADLFKERPVSIYHNQAREWLHKVLCFVAWRTSLWEANSTHQSEEKR
jgi:hypothetical protein